MKENIKKFFKNESLLMKTFPWTLNSMNLFFLSLVFIFPLFMENPILKDGLPFVFILIWAIFYYFLRKKLLNGLQNDRYMAEERLKDSKQKLLRDNN